MQSYHPNGQPQYAQQPQYPQYPQYPATPYPQNGSAWYTPVPAPESKARPAPKKGKRSGGNGGGSKNSRQSPGTPQKPPKRSSFKWQFVKFLVLLLVLGGISLWGYSYKIQSDARPYLNTFLDNITIDGIDVSGMTKEQASAAVWAQASAKQTGWYVRLKNASGQYTDITSETLNIQFDPSQALEQAWTIGRTPSQRPKTFVNAVMDRLAPVTFLGEVERMKKSSAEFYSIQPSADTAPVDTILQRLEVLALVAPQDAKLIGFNPDDALNPFAFQQERIGQRLDTAALKEQILQMVQTFQSGEVLVAPEPVYPEVTVADLQKNVSLLCRAVTPIDRHSTEERNNNIRVAFERINGLEIGNGSKFSFNKVVGRRTERNGFFPAFEYNYGELVTGWGGGVCQASTTVYLAAIQAGMTITDRTPHSTPVSYTQLGQDATVSDDRLDFTFRNNLGSPVYMTAHLVPDAANKSRLLCEVRIYGPSTGNTSYRLFSEVVEIIPAPIEEERINDTKGTHVTYVGEEKVVIAASAGSVVNSYLITYVDGQEIDRKLISTDTYPNRKARIYVGVTPVF